MQLQRRQGSEDMLGSGTAHFLPLLVCLERKPPQASAGPAERGGPGGHWVGEGITCGAVPPLINSLRSWRQPPSGFT